MDPDRRAALRTLAEEFLDGRRAPLETALALSVFEEEAPEALRDLLTSMVGLASQTDDIPLGHRREFWHPDVRAREDAKHDQAQAWAEPMVRETCEGLLREL